MAIFPLSNFCLKSVALDLTIYPAPAQSSTQDGTATEAVTQSEPQAKQKAEPSGNSETGKADGGKSGGAESPGENDNSQEENKQEIAELNGKVLI